MRTGSRNLFRKPPFYPLNYGDADIFDFRFSIDDFSLANSQTKLAADRDMNSLSKLGQDCLTLVDDGKPS